jgi:hypothetical protein
VPFLAPMAIMSSSVGLRKSPPKRIEHREGS